MDLIDQITAVPSDGRGALPIGVGVGLLAAAIVTFLIGRAEQGLQREGKSQGMTAFTWCVGVSSVLFSGSFAGGIAAAIVNEVDDHHDARVTELVAQYVYDNYDLVAISPADLTETTATFEALDADGHTHAVAVTWRADTPVSLVAGVPAPARRDALSVTISAPTGQD